MNNKTTIKDKIKQFACKLLKEGYSTEEIAANLNLNPNSVRAWKAWQHPTLVARRVK